LKHAANDPAEDQFWSLTGREREVMQLIAEGRNTRQIARMLGVAAATVNSHRTATMAKLGLHNTAEIVRFAVRSGVVR
jgi:DNA-binding CsgD family transcriptional regulator